jgi:hypothetical protein
MRPRSWRRPASKLPSDAQTDLQVRPGGRPSETPRCVRCIGEFVFSVHGRMLSPAKARREQDAILRSAWDQRLKPGRARRVRSAARGGIDRGQGRRFGRMAYEGLPRQVPRDRTLPSQRRFLTRAPGMHIRDCRAGRTVTQMGARRLMSTRAICGRSKMDLSYALSAILPTTV